MTATRAAYTSVVVVGAGFAGAACTKRLAARGVQVTLIDRHNYRQFQPLLYQVATAQVSSVGVARPIRDEFRRSPTVDVEMAEVSKIDPVARSVTCSDGTTFAGDYLVLAMGAKPNFFDTTGAEQNSFPLYGLVHAERLRSRVFEAFEEAHRNPSLIERGALNFVVVGAGATGVESAGALADLVNRVLPGKFRDHCVDAARIYVIDPAPVVLAPFSERAQSYAGKVLRDKGVQLELGLRVTEVRPDRVVLSDGREILTRTVIWAGGIEASAVAGTAGLPQGHGGRLVAEPDLTVRGFPRVYALGDVAETPGADGTPLPQLGSVALQAGAAAADNILADLEGRARLPFHYHDKGILAMIGRSAAIAELGHKRRELHGAAAWAAWLGIHAYLLSGFRERATAVREWAWDYFTKSRAPAVIDRSDAARIDWSVSSTPVSDEVKA